LGFWRRYRVRASFVLGPEAQSLHDPLAQEHLVDEPVLDVEPTGEGSAQITHQRLLGRRLAEGILCQELQQLLGLGLEGR
jgi:hypothetical protein